MGFYNPWWFFWWTNPDGWLETSDHWQSGHGTAMSKIIGGPQASNFKGIGYDCDLVSIRTSFSVWIDLPQSSLAITRAYEYISNRNGVKIVSMSQRGILDHRCIVRAIRLCHSRA